MKKWLWILLFPIFYASCDKEIVITEEEIKPDIYYAGAYARPYTGVCKIYFRDSEVVKEELNFKRGRLHGPFQAYYRNGETRWNGTYQKGLQTGKWEKYDESGKLILEAYYKNDTLVSFEESEQ